MTAGTFGTYTAAKRLRDAGFDENQAEAAVTMVRDAFGADRDEFATKTDLDTLEARIDARLEALEGRIYRALWMQGGAIAALILAARLL